MKIIPLSLLLIASFGCDQIATKEPFLPSANKPVKLVLETIVSKDGNKYTLYTDSSWSVSPGLAKTLVKKSKKTGGKSSQKSGIKEGSTAGPSSGNTAEV